MHRGQTQIFGLDAVRCFAALVVLVFHFCYAMNVTDYNGAPTTHPFIVPSIESISASGWVGVEIFFVISGFVIAYSASASTALAFARSRFLRLFPTLWICSAFSVIALIADGKDDLRKIASLWLHAVVLVPWTKLWLDGAYWTLPIELSFYAVVLVLLAFRSYRYLDHVMIAVGLLSAASNVYCFALQVRLIEPIKLLYSLLHADTASNAGPLLIRHGLYFALGVLLWSWSFRERSLLRFITMWLLICGAYAEMALRSEELRKMVMTAHAPITVTNASGAIVIWTMAVALIVFSVAYNQRIGTLLGPHCCALLRKGGLATYPIYLVHLTVGQVLMSHLREHLPTPVALLLAVCSVILLATLVLPVIERPVQKSLRSWLDLGLRAKTYNSLQQR